MTDGAAVFIELLDELARTRGRIDLAFRDIRTMHGLTEVENVVLIAVTGADRPPTVPQIGRSLGHPRQVIQRAADVLIARGLLTSHDNPDHKRARLLGPTAEGLRLRRVADAAGLKRAAEVTDGLDPGLIAAAVGDLRDIRERLEHNLRGTAAATGKRKDR